MAKIGVADLLNLAELLSVSVGLLNLMSVPLLDGGHLFYHAREAIQGKSFEPKNAGAGVQGGPDVGPVISSSYNDILRPARQMILCG